MKVQSRLVYSSEHGRICSQCQQPIKSCSCFQAKARPAGDGGVRIRRESKGRGGKVVTVIAGVPLESEDLKQLAADLKKRCGTGGTIKDWTIEIQGDHVELLIAELQRRGFSVKRAGG